jgi:hypothetical protein
MANCLLKTIILVRLTSISTAHRITSSASASSSASPNSQSHAWILSNRNARSPRGTDNLILGRRSNATSTASSRTNCVGSARNSTTCHLICLSSGKSPDGSIPSGLAKLAFANPLISSLLKLFI